MSDWSKQIDEAWGVPVLTLEQPPACKYINGRKHLERTCPDCQENYWRRVDNKPHPIWGYICQSCQRKKVGIGIPADHPTRKRAIQKQADQLRANMNPPEKKVQRWLVWAGVKHRAQFPVYLDGYHAILDFVIVRNGKPIAAIEVNGFWHDLTRQERDFRLSVDLPYPLLFVNAADCCGSVAAARKVRSQIAEFLDQHNLRAE
jgi:hypothetical protein